MDGGAGPDSDLIKKMEGYQTGLERALKAGHALLEKGGSALDAVAAAVDYLEYDPLFNSGHGSALNEDAG